MSDDAWVWVAIVVVALIVGGLLYAIYGRGRPVRRPYPPDRVDRRRDPDDPTP